MIEFNDLVKEMDRIIEAHNGVSYAGRTLFGNATLSFINGWRKEKYDITLSVLESKGRTEGSIKAGGSSDAVDKQ